MVKDDRFYMRLALQQAETALASGEIPIGAVIVDENGNIVADGHNMRELWKDATAHAEVVAIRRAGHQLGHWRLPSCTMYVTVEPCPMCAGALVMSRMKRVVYGCPDAKAGAVESLFNITGHPALNHRVEVTAGVLEDACTAVMKRFFEQRRKEKGNSPKT